MNFRAKFPFPRRKSSKAKGIEHEPKYNMADRRSGGSSRNNFNDEKSPADIPPMSRLFIICSKTVTDDILREHFEKFGEIEEIWIVKDRQSGDAKGVAYIKFSKTSEAARALEEMNGKTIGDNSRPIKVRGVLGDVLIETADYCLILGVGGSQQATRFPEANRQRGREIPTTVCFDPEGNERRIAAR